ncbi:hypothetical protein HY483_03870 [Candidatus Woesearchaeota archaeon]|nr:hypothetical protein [Candidatus Woesearchaeota archaeon]
MTVRKRIGKLRSLRGHFTGLMVMVMFGKHRLKSAGGRAMRKTLLLISIIMALLTINIVSADDNTASNASTSTTVIPGTFTILGTLFLYLITCKYQKSISKFCFMNSVA